MPKKQKEEHLEVEISKKRVKKFFDKLNSSSLKRLMDLQTIQEKVEAVLKFSDIIGIPRTKLPMLMSSLRKNLK